MELKNTNIFVTNDDLTPFVLKYHVISGKEIVLVVCLHLMKKIVFMNNDELLVNDNLYKLQNWNADVLILFHFLYAELMTLCCGDFEWNRGSEMCYE